MSKIGVKGLPFKYKGSVNVEDCSTSKEALIKSNLNFEVDKCEIVSKISARTEDKNRNDGFVYGGDLYVNTPNAFSIYRTDYNIPLGIVKGKYTIVQNTDAFSFFDNAIGKNKAIWQTAGCFGNGERIFVSAKLPKNIFVNGDPVENYLIFTNSHDGSSGVKILFSPIRVICQNTLNAAIKSSSNFVSFRHTKMIHSKIDMSSEILGICDTKIRFVSEQYNKMYKIKMNDTKAEESFAKLILNNNELNNIKNTGHTIKQIVNRDWRAIQDSEISMKKVNIITGINDYYHTGIGQSSIEGTAWGVYNAVTGFYSNVDNSEGIKRMDTLLYGDRANKIKTMNDLILN